jgi:hypothetical protein
MNRCYLQRWEESERGWGIRPDGCSLHSHVDSHRIYLQSIYDNREADQIPDEYERVSGPLVECFISDNLFQILKSKESLRLHEYEMNNLIDTEEIFFKIWHLSQ